jgi:hypothetical protein
LEVHNVSPEKAGVVAVDTDPLEKKVHHNASPEKEKAPVVAAADTDALEKNVVVGHAVRALLEIALLETASKERAGTFVELETVAAA